jgi:hypothetical protein
MLLNH